MATSNKPSDDNAGSKRAADFHQAMLGLPGYGDDSIFFIVRYINSAKQKLRTCDFDELMQCFVELNQLWPEHNQEAPQGDISRHEKAEELKKKARSKIEEFPDLNRDFDRMLSNSRSVANIFGKLENKK